MTDATSFPPGEQSTPPDVLEIQPVNGPVRGVVRPPGSKSFSNRALPIAAVAEGESLLTGLLDSEDTRVMIDSLTRLGIVLNHDPANRTIRIQGCGGKFPASEASLFLANSGTSIRFLTAILAAGQGVYRLDGVQRMRERPIGDLIAALQALDVDIQSEANNDCPPVLIRANGVRGGGVNVRGDVSSQFLSALLMAAPLARNNFTIAVDGVLVSQPYVDMTLATMEAFGVTCQRQDYREFFFPAGQKYVGTEYAIEPDASGASYFFGVAAITGGEVSVDGLGERSLQGDLGFVRVLESMGCTVEMTADRTTVQGGRLHGVDVDLCDLSDTVPTLAAVACFADSPTRIRNVAHVRRKETDRIAALVTELRKTGLEIEEHEDGLTIHPGPMQPAAFDTYDDHRMAMSLSLVGLKVPGVLIRDPACTSKTYPEFFADLDRVTASAR